MTSREYSANKKAWKFFYPAGNGLAMTTIDPITGEEIEWVLHHEDIELKKNDPVRYGEWRIEDLVMMKRRDHTALHHKGKKQVGHPVSDETKAILSIKLKNRKFSDESREKMSKSMKGRIPWNKGKKLGEEIE